MQNKRQIVLDTETTGMNQDGRPHYLGHKIIEIGAVEMINRRLTGNHFHVYINPKRKVDEEAFNVHGLSDEFLQDKPLFNEIADSFIKFVDDAELIIHNAPFDVGFLNYELSECGRKWLIEDHCIVTDSLTLAKKMFPNKRNNLDALCQRYDIDNSHRTLHGALLDAEILAEVYLAMTGGQTSLSLNQESESKMLSSNTEGVKFIENHLPSRVIKATSKELERHQEILDSIMKKNDGRVLWQQ